ncbi:MAG: hypothetical protein WC187_04960 [Bacillota bacterium]
MDDIFRWPLSQGQPFDQGPLLSKQYNLEDPSCEFWNDFLGPCTWLYLLSGESVSVTELLKLTLTGGWDMSMGEIKFAGTVVEVDSQVVAKVSSFERAISINEEEVTGSGDVVAGSYVLQQQFVAISVGETVTLEGIALEGTTGADQGQSDLRDAAESGDTVTIKHTRNTGYGVEYTGFFTAYAETGSISGVYRFNGTFRVNSKSDVVPGS